MRLVNTKTVTTGLQPLGLSLCVNDELVLIRGKVNEYGCIRGFTRARGTMELDIRTQCQHEYCGLIDHPAGQKSIVETCNICDSVRAYQLETKDVTVCGHCKALRSCPGPEGTLVILDQKYDIVQLRLNSETKQFDVVKHVPTVGVKGVRDICHVSLYDILVITAGFYIKALRLSDGALEWEMTHAVEDKDLYPQGVTSDDIGQVYVADGGNARLLLLDGSSGRLLQVLLLEEEKEWISDVAWHPNQPQLIVLHGPRFGEKKLSLYNVE